MLWRGGFAGSWPASQPEVAPLAMASKSLSSCRGHLLLVLGFTQHLAHQEELPPYQPNLPFKDLLADLFLANTLSAQKLHTLASSSAASGAQGLQDLVAAGAHGTAPQNLARDVLRTCTRSSPWPAPCKHPCDEQGYQAGMHGQHSCLAAP